MRGGRRNRTATDPHATRTMQRVAAGLRDGRAGHIMRTIVPITERRVDHALAPTRRIVCIARLAVRLRLQRDPAEGRGGFGGLVGSVEPVPAARRPGAEPRQYGQGLCRARTGSLHARDRGAFARRYAEDHPGHALRSAGDSAVPGCTGRAVERADPAHGGVGELPDAQGRWPVPEPAGATRGHREPHHRRTQSLHRGGA